jgi:hypothetical protein
MATQLTGNSDSGGGGMDYMSGIAKIGGTLNDTWAQYHTLFKELGIIKDPNDPVQKQLGMEQQKIDLDKLNSKASRGATDRGQDMQGLDFLANQRQNASKNANLAGFRNALWAGSKNGTI